MLYLYQYRHRTPIVAEMFREAHNSNKIVLDTIITYPEFTLDWMQDLYVPKKGTGEHARWVRDVRGNYWPRAINDSFKAQQLPYRLFGLRKDGVLFTDEKESINLTLYKFFRGTCLAHLRALREVGILSLAVTDENKHRLQIALSVNEESLYAYYGRIQASPIFSQSLKEKLAEDLDNYEKHKHKLFPNKF